MDIVGDAGGIVYLLQVYKQTGNKKYLETAVKAGEYIEQFANPAKTVVHIIICMTLWLRMKATKIQSMLIFPWLGGNGVSVGSAL